LAKALTLLESTTEVNQESRLAKEQKAAVEDKRTQSRRRLTEDVKSRPGPTRIDRRTEIHSRPRCLR
jgi:hypothetical protein